MLSLFLLLLATDVFCQSEQEQDSTLEFEISNAPDCQAITRQVHTFLFEQYPVPAFCSKAKKLGQKYSDALALLEEQCLQQRSVLESALIDPQGCENSLAVFSSEESSSLEETQSYFNCKEDDLDCIDLCDVYSSMYLLAIMKSGNIARALRTTLASNTTFACMADRNSNCVDALAAVSKKMPVYLDDSEDLKSCFEQEATRKPATLNEDRISLFARIHSKIVSAAAAGRL